MIFIISDGELLHLLRYYRGNLYVNFTFVEKAFSYVLISEFMYLKENHWCLLVFDVCGGIYFLRGNIKVEWILCLGMFKTNNLRRKNSKLYKKCTFPNFNIKYFRFSILDSGGNEYQSREGLNQDIKTTKWDLSNLVSVLQFYQISVLDTVGRNLWQKLTLWKTERWNFLNMTWNLLHFFAKST